jgi:hypothetical protein
MSGKKQCITCSKSGGVLICDGCQQTFCGKHVIEHRQEISNQLDGIMQEHNLIQQELGRTSVDDSLLKNIDKWEKESIMKIQVSAEAARLDIQRMMDKSNERFLKTWHDIAENLRFSREADDYTENDLTRWIQKLKKLKFEIQSPPTMMMIEDKTSVIHLITIQSGESTNRDSESNKRHSVLKRLPALSLEERFSKVIEMGSIHERGLIAECTGKMLDYAFVLGEQLYSQGQQTIRFKIERSTKPYNIFFGCISSKANQTEISYGSPFAVGWFGVNEVYQHGLCENNSNLHGYMSNDISTNDVLHLTFDCQKRQLKLFHERSNNTYTLPVDIEKAPFPWQLLLVLTRINDCVRILL